MSEFWGGWVSRAWLWSFGIIVGNAESQQTKNGDEKTRRTELANLRLSVPHFLT